MGLKGSFGSLAVITPIGRESETIRDFIMAVQENLDSNDLHFLITDSFTDEETKRIIAKLAREKKNLKWHHLDSSDGIASVYLAGYEHALRGNFSHFLEIDAGFSHDPSQIKDFKSLAGIFDVVLGNRFDRDSEYSSTPMRKVISFGGSMTARAFLRLPFRDLTSGYQLFSRDAISEVLRAGIQSKGPFFQTEMKFWAYRLKFEVCEIPIRYSNPTHKVKWYDLRESLFHLFRLRFGLT
jgi:dolichol-phosphate mannosyltransferase